LKDLWLKIDKTLSPLMKTKLLNIAKQSCDVIIVEEEDLEKAKNVGIKIASSSTKGDIDFVEEDTNEITNLKNKNKPTALRIAIRGKKEEERAIKAAKLSFEYIILDCPDWKVLPLENIIAKTRGKSKLLAEVSSLDDVKLALKTLELGTDGVVLRTSDPSELMKIASTVKKRREKLELDSIEITNVQQIGVGARVCVDTCDIMKSGEGILVGCQSAGLFLIEAEVNENPYVETRPFRVNAGPVSLYNLSSIGKTRYLSELKAGDEVLIVNKEGNARTTNIGRIKIEWRPLILIEAKIKEKVVKVILQNAETIKLVTDNGSISIAELKKGDKVLAYITKDGGRHFGTLVKEETVMER